MLSSKDWPLWRGALSVVFPVLGLTLIADLGTKVWAAERLATQPIVLSDWFRLTYAENPGIAFSLPLGGPLLIFINVLLLLVLVAMAPRLVNLSHTSAKVALGLILGGGLGNLYDRVCFGIVRDFLDVGPWPVFNLADTALTVGLLLLIIHFYFPPHE